MTFFACRRHVLIACALLLCASSPILAQQVLRGSIAGTIRDETAAALPGVTVTVTSPALQVPQILRVSDERGDYQVTELPAGMYRVSYELPGFATLIREGIVLTTGFAARVDAIMKVATLAETITVSGETPLVDLTSTRGGATVSKDLITAVPGNQNFPDVMLLVGGTQVSGPPLTGQITAGGGGFGGKTYGAGGGTAVIEGVRMNTNEVPDFTAYEEVDVKTFGNGAEVDVPGATVQLVVKSGGNQFHGRYNEIAQHRRFESTNVDADLRAQGITTGDTIVYYNDLSADLGGRIIRDKLWFYGGVRDMRNKRTVAGYSQDAGPDRRYQTADDAPGYPTARHLSTTIKISYQATPKNRFIGFHQYNPDYTYQDRGDRFTPYESTMKQYQLSGEGKPIEWQGALSNRWVVNMMYGMGGYNSVFWYRDEYRDAWKGVPSRLDRTTGQNTGPSQISFAARRNQPTRNQWTGSVNYLPAGSFLGSHALQLGYRAWWGTQFYMNPNDPDKNRGIGEYQLIYDTVAGVPHRPVEMVTHNYPVNGKSRQNVFAWYGQDTWRATRRLTLNLGLRWERQVHFVPPQVKEQGTFGASGSFPKVDAGSWTRWAPRVGVAYDLSGDGKTVVKGTYGWFNDDLGVNGYAQGFSQNSQVNYTFRWRDLDGNDDYTPGIGEVNLDVNGPDFLSVTGATNNRVNPDLRLPHTHEISASVEREILGSLSIRGLYVHKRIVDAFTAANVLRPFAVYDQVFTRRDPGPDGLLNTADDGGPITIYDYNPAYRGAAFIANMNTNVEADRSDSFNSVEVTLTKRTTGRWFANTSVLAIKNHRYLTGLGVVQSPNDLVNSLDATWDLSYRLAGGYTLPYDLNVSTLYQAYNGLQRQRTNIFRAADPAGGRAFPSSGTITMRMEPFGEQRGAPRHIVNFRLAKEVNISGGRAVTLGVDAFNAFNSNVAWGGGGGAGSGITDTSGPTYGYVVRVVTPRVLRFSVGYEF